MDELRRRLLACPGIRGVHDVIVHNYGPRTYFASAHAEVDRDGDLVAMHNILEAAELEIARCMPVRVILHCDPYVTADPQTRLWRQRCEDAVHAIDRQLVVYDLNLDASTDGPVLHFHLLMPRNYPLSHDAISAQLTEALQAHDHNLHVHVDFISSFV